jgi:hypothetical protein
MDASMISTGAMPHTHSSVVWVYKCLHIIVLAGSNLHYRVYHYHLLLLFYSISNLRASYCTYTLCGSTALS